MHTANINKFTGMILDQLENAEEKHPQFADVEATEAWLQRDKEHCLEELAQCGAVILRMMEFVEKEK